MNTTGLADSSNCYEWTVVDNTTINMRTDVFSFSSVLANSGTQAGTTYVSTNYTTSLSLLSLSTVASPYYLIPNSQKTDSSGSMCVVRNPVVYSVNATYPLTLTTTDNLAGKVEPIVSIIAK